MLKQLIQQAVGAFGYIIHKKRYGHLHYIRSYLEANKVSSVLDIGANCGQFAEELFAAGYKSDIFSLEPVQASYEKLAAKALGHQKWHAINVGAGDCDCESIINISANSVSSSMLEETSLLAASEASSAFIGVEKVKIRTIDSLVLTSLPISGNLFVKIDAQGYESRILSGAIGTVDRIAGFLVECSTVQIYKDQSTYLDIFNYMEENRFVVADIIPGFRDRQSDFLYQFDALFIRRDLAETSF